MILVKSMYNALFATKSKDWYEKEYDRIIGEINAIYGEDEEGVNQHVETSYMPDAKIYRYNGKYIQIDNDDLNQMYTQNSRISFK